MSPYLCLYHTLRRFLCTLDPPGTPDPLADTGLAPGRTDPTCLSVIGCGMGRVRARRKRAGSTG